MASPSSATPAMFSRFFIERPIFATVVSLIIVHRGPGVDEVLPVEQYPTITPVQIKVTTTYPGADSKTVGDSVAAPIEAQINGVDNMLYMTSTSSNTGQMTITVYFTLDTDPDIAQVQVQNRVNLAMPQLPEAVTQYGVSVQKKSSSILMIIAVFDKDGRYSPDYVANYTNVYILDAIKRVNGAGQAQIFGVPDQAMRIWMNPDRMASLGITTTDIQNAVANQNALFGAGQVGAQPNSGNVQLTFPVVTQAPFVNPLQYENIILRASQDGSAIVRVKDVARAEVGRRQYIDDNRFNGAPATPIVVYQQPGANGLNVSAGVRKTMEDMKRLSRGHRVRHRARHHRFRAPLDRGGDPHALRSHRAGRAGRVPVPAELPLDDHLYGRDLRFVDRYLRRHARARVLDQPADAVRHRARHRHGRRRRHRRGGERRTQHGRSLT